MKQKPLAGSGPELDVNMSPCEEGHQGGLFLLWGCVAGLLGIGLVMSFSVGSAWLAYDLAPGGSSRLVLRYAASLATGLAALLAMARLDYRKLRPLAPLLAFTTLVLLALVLIPAFGWKAPGMPRALPIGPLRLNPSELAGPAMALFLAAVLAPNTSSRGVLVALGFVAVSSVLLLVKPDFSAALILNLTALVVLLLAGQRRSWVLMAFGLEAVGAFFLLLHSPVRLMRMLAFFCSDCSSAASRWLPLAAIEGGGWRGLGLGQSAAIQYYLPVASADFISAVLGEELGWVALLVVAALLAVFVAAGFHLSRRAPDAFGRWLGCGICAFIAAQAAVHFAVVFHWLPLRGVALPFVSQDSLGFIAMLGAVGTLLNIAGSPRSPAASCSVKKGVAG